MTLFAFTTDACQKDATKNSLSDELLRFKARIERTQSTSQFDPFPPPYLVKKKFGRRQGRLIADLRSIDEHHDVVVLLGMLIRGDRAYQDQFSKDPTEYGRQHFTDIVTDVVLRRSLTNALESMRPAQNKCLRKLNSDFFMNPFLATRTPTIKI